MDNRRQDDVKLQEMEVTLKTLEVKLDTLQKDVEDLVAAWKAASWLVGFVKWTGSLAAAFTAIYILLKGFK